MTRWFATGGGPFWGLVVCPKCRRQANAVFRWPLARGDGWVMPGYRTRAQRIVCSGSHLWTLERRTGKGTAFEQATVTTEQLAGDYIRGGGQGGTAGLRYRTRAGVE